VAEPRKPRIATVSLAGCFGCHMAILDIDERLNAIMHSDAPLRDCLEEAYITGKYIRNATHAIPNDPALPLMLDKVYPCSEVVEIDYQIPGCAPSGDIIFNTLTAILAGRFHGFAAESIKFD
jgi:NAD-reducing hydrogenase small subunit